MQNITEIEQYYLGYRTEFRGTLRNERVFTMHQNVFFEANLEHKHRLLRGKIVGVELEPDMNPNYKYKIALDPDIIYALGLKNKVESANGVKGCGDYTYKNLKCDAIFENVEQAKKAAIDHIEFAYQQSIDNLNRFFEEFEKLNNSN